MGVFSGSTEMEITSFDTSTQLYTVKTTLTVGDQKSDDEQQVKASDLLTDDLIASTIAQCLQMGGKLEKILVPAGSFDTCAIVIEDENELVTTWVAQVPFGIAKSISQMKVTGEIKTSELQAYRPGR